MSTLKPKTFFRFDKRILLDSLFVIGLIAILYFAYRSDKNSGVETVFATEPIVINYSALIDRSIYTHSQETVGEVINKLRSAPQSPELRGLVQPYLEPFSELCQYAIISHNGLDSISMVNVTDFYPIGSEQPAWVALLREGHYQIFFNRYLIRIFIEGVNPRVKFNKELPVLRHPIRDIINSQGLQIKSIEVYCFKNDYETSEIELFTNRLDLDISELNLESKKQPIDLASLGDFFSRGPLPEAIEIDDEKNLYIYGTLRTPVTVAGSPIELSDLAVAYRAVFHSGDNSPYVSLDKHEDNRYAKVNFGGHLEDTRFGDVLYEADRAFKILSTGVDPSNHTIIGDEIRNHVFGFKTEAERSLMDDRTEGHTEYRYWFYPDSLATVTDGTIGAVKASQFWADVERMDVKTLTGKPQKETITHLNTNYNEYTSSLPILSELDVVGRLTSLFTWAQVMDVESSTDLASLLSVKLPAITTPRKTPKLLVSNSISINGSSRNIKTKDLSELVTNASPSLTDSQFIELGSQATEPPKRLEQQVDEMKKRLDRMDDDYENKERLLRQRERNLNQYDQTAVDEYNRNVEELNTLGQRLESETNTYNSFVGKYNSYNRYEVVSVGGGIEMSPKKIKPPINERNAKEILRIRDVKSSLPALRNNNSKWIRSSFNSRREIVNAFTASDFSALQVPTAILDNATKTMRVSYSSLSREMVLKQVSDRYFVASASN